MENTAEIVRKQWHNGNFIQKQWYNTVTQHEPRISLHHCIELSMNRLWWIGCAETEFRFVFLKTRTETKPKGQTRNIGFRGFSQNRTCLIQIVNIWAILTEL